VVAAVLAVGLTVSVAAPGSAGAGRGTEVFGSAAGSAKVALTLPPGFTDTKVFDHLHTPTVIQFAPDGRVFVGEKVGTIQVFPSISDNTATLVKDLSSEVYAAPDSDRGLLGLALDPNFATNGYVYVLYTLDAPIGETPPVYNDFCDDSLGGACVVGARLARFQVFADNTSGPEEVLLEGWCQQFPSHSIGALAFGPDGALYVGGGDGASYEFADYGQVGNPCGDPLKQGGALRSQDLLTTREPTGFDGTILRVDPATGAAMPDNPLIGGDPSDDRIIADGMRNPYRFTVKPGTDRIIVGDVGWNRWEEIDRIGSAGDSVVENFGWPCREGSFRVPEYAQLKLRICKTLYADKSLTTKPVLALSHTASACEGSNVMSGITFYSGGSYPAQYTGALFFADIVRGCIWTMLPKVNGDPDPSTFANFASGIQAVDLKIGPGGDIYYPTLFGEIHRISFS
jgi:glucose/arabinose dehydrogenase